VNKRLFILTLVVLVGSLAAGVFTCWTNYQQSKNNFDSDPLYVVVDLDQKEKFITLSPKKGYILNPSAGTIYRKNFLPRLFK